VKEDSAEDMDSTHVVRRRTKRLSADEKEARFAQMLKFNDGRHNVTDKDVYFFQRAGMFYHMLSFVITCNSLYMAWWATSFIFVILSHESGSLNRLGMAVISLIPPVIAFPTIFLAIRSASIMKAITVLDLTVVAKVIEQSKENTATLVTFRKVMLKVMKRQGEGVEGMVKTCNEFAEHNSYALKKSEFREMLFYHKIIYTTEKINFLFGVINLNLSSTTLKYEVSTVYYSVS
jgi:hypothetical protein